MIRSIIKKEGGLRCRGIKKSLTGEWPFVSIIMAVYNAGDAVLKTIESISSQTWPNKELLIVDGGSFDGTLELIRKSEERVDYWISEKDQGTYDAYNKGIRLAEGNWLYFTGAGDTFTDEAVLEKLFSPTPKGRFLYGNVLWGNTRKLYDGKFSKLKICRRNICHQAIFYHRELFRDLGEFDTRYRLLADWAFNIRCFGHSPAAPEYRNIAVARFNLDGLSATSSDEVFEAAKDEHILECMGRRYLGLAKLNRYQRRIVKNLEKLFKFWK